MSQKYEKLKSLLKELFQLDQPDLDFGLYRIMHAKAGEVTAFLERDLLPQVKAEFGQYKTADKAELEQQLAKAIEQAQSLGADPETLPKVKDLREKLKSDAVDISALEGEVYDHLISFFSRYYSEGDFLSKRRYSRDGRYAIPYDGEEVKLYWANHDQYYIKTSEYLRDYAFRLKPHNDANPMRVHFRLADAAEGEHGNIKPPNGKDRVFILAINDFASLEQGELSIRFEFRPATLTDWPDEIRPGKTKPPAQKDLTDIAEKRILAVTEATVLLWVAELAKPHVKADDEKADYTRIRAHLNRYFARNTFDYFIHKDLGGFLRREVDFYIKNEVMHLDDVENETAPRVDQYLSKIKVIRRIAGKIITFLAQLEDFEKTLWLKRKFVVETQYCVALCQIPDTFLPEIVANDAQWAEWESLHHLSALKKEDDGLFAKKLKVKSADFLKANQSLMIDTSNFGADFTARLIEAIGDLEAKTDGVLFHSENFQALSAMQARYREQVKCIYIDPPYNTDASAIDYKNGYKSSSWMSLLSNRIALSRFLLTEDGDLIAAIDDEQQRELSFILTEQFGGRLLGTICVRANPSGRPTQTGYSVSHEYLLFAGATAKSSIGRLPPTEDQMARFSQHDNEGVFEWRNLRREGSNSDRDARRALYYPIYILDQHIRVPRMTWNPQTEEWIVEEQPTKSEQVVWPDNEDGVQKNWRWEWQTVLSSLNKLLVRPDRSGRDYIYYKRRPHEDGVVSVSSWFDAKYSATEHGTALLKSLFGQSPFSYPKSIHAVLDAIYIGGASNQTTTVLDYFGGSGTTGHAVINLNREDGGRRQFILVEMGNHFDAVLVPRLKKIAFTPEWKDGRPARLPSTEEAERGPRIFKIVRLESYEDTLNNLEVTRSATQQSLLDATDAQGADKLREQYLLRYMLKVETRESPSLLNVAAFTDPTLYRLMVKRPGSDDSRDVNVDLIETFNWLLGLKVQHIAVPHVFSAQFERDKEKRLVLKDRIKPDESGPHWFRAITGTMPDGRMALVIWRKLTSNPEEDNLVLDEWFTKQGYSSKDTEFGLIYVNGGNNLENLKAADDTWKVRLIEDDFQRLMFATEGQ
jgi:adenine-specific DNA-methyltransferase